MILTLSLLNKTQLTHDVFWLQFESKWDANTPIEWQFITFLLPKSWGRAYSILKYEGNRFEFIIKRLENGKWGSMEICDTPIWTELKAVGPAGHFILKTTNKNKLFLWTGTGFVPLYYQILGATEKKLTSKLTFIFWVREEKDIFYKDELKNISRQNTNFSYYLYLSQEENENYNFWRINQYITKENIEAYEEFYICGNPGMVEDIEAKLIELWVNQENIYNEKY